MFKKKIIAAFAAIVAVAALAVSCQKEGPKFFSLNITLNEKFEEGVPSPASYNVVFTNTNTADTYEVKSTGKTVSIKDLPKGVYDIVASATESIYNYLGTASGVTIDKEDAITSIDIKVTKASGIIFKEIFYCCSKTPENKSYLKDNFFEIYNNGDQPVYVDGLCIGGSTNYSSSTIKFDNEKGNMVDPEGKDLGIKADDYFVVNGSNSIVWQIPGNGKTYLLNPGESFIIASSAVNHTAAELNPNSIDLSSAEFETICDKYKEKGQVDNPKSVDLILVNPLNQNITNQYMPSVMTAGFCLFYIDQKLEDIPVVVSVLSSAVKYLAIPKANLFDAVNWVANATTDKFLPNDMDAGKIWCSGTYTNQSIMRKVDKQLDGGRAIYKDTNNSSDDFEVSDKPEIRRNGAKKASWAE